MIDDHRTFRRLRNFGIGQTSWHIDADAAGTGSFDPCFNTWLPLNDVGDELPSLELVENSSRRCGDCRCSIPPSLRELMSGGAKISLMSRCFARRSHPATRSSFRTMCCTGPSPSYRRKAPNASAASCDSHFATKPENSHISAAAQRSDRGTEWHRNGGFHKVRLDAREAVHRGVETGSCAQIRG